MKSIRKIIQDGIKNTGLRPYQIADLAGVPRPSVYRYIKGERDIGTIAADKILKIIRPE